MPRVALPPVQAAAVRTHFELVLVASLQRPHLGLEAGHGHLVCRPVGAGRQQRAVQNLKAVQVMRLGGQGLQLLREHSMDHEPELVTLSLEVFELAGPYLPLHL